LAERQAAVGAVPAAGIGVQGDRSKVESARRFAGASETSSVRNREKSGSNPFRFCKHLTFRAFTRTYVNSLRIHAKSNFRFQRFHFNAG
jgi:hypothetical protein